ncbi:hypothetical protein HDU76_009812 [Blyttiomyces sp. JEL0837]|nr:hypothetical protein HDU76_009812 [Blyttiomyces sp. JEL0837]
MTKRAAAASVAADSPIPATTTTTTGRSTSKKTTTALTTKTKATPRAAIIQREKSGATPSAASSSNVRGKRARMHEDEEEDNNNADKEDVVDDKHVGDGHNDGDDDKTGNGRKKRARMSVVIGNKGDAHDEGEEEVQEEGMDVDVVDAVDVGEKDLESLSTRELQMKKEMIARIEAKRAESQKVEHVKQKHVAVKPSDNMEVDIEVEAKGDEAHAVEIDIELLHDMKVSDVIVLAKKEGVSYQGKKAEIIAKIVAKRNGASTSGSAAPEEVADQEEAHEAAPEVEKEEEQREESKDQLDAETLESMKVTEIIELAKKEGLSYRGKKSEIIARIVAHRNGASTSRSVPHEEVADQEEEAHEAAPEVAPESEIPEDERESSEEQLDVETLKSMKVSDIIELAKKEGVSYRGKKSELIARILAKRCGFSTSGSEEVASQEEEAQEAAPEGEKEEDQHEDSEEQLDAEALESMKATEIIELAKKQGISYKGKKSEIIERILSNRKSGPANEEDDEEDEKAEEQQAANKQVGEEEEAQKPEGEAGELEEIKDLEHMKAVDVIEVAKKEGVPYTGKKSDIIERIAEKRRKSLAVAPVDEDMGEVADAEQEKPEEGGEGEDSADVAKLEQMLAEDVRLLARKEKVSYQGKKTDVIKRIVEKRRSSGVMAPLDQENEADEAEAQPEGLIEIEDLRQMQAEEVRAVARSEGVRYTGKKDDIIKRIAQKRRESSTMTVDLSNQDDAEEEGQDEDDEEEPNDEKALNEMKIAELIAAAKEEGVSYSGKKAEIIKRIMKKRRESSVTMTIDIPSSEEVDEADEEEEEHREKGKEVDVEEESAEE